MKYVLIILLGICIWYYLNVYRKRQLINSMIEVVDHVKVGLYQYFLSQLEGNDLHYNKLLSAAAINGICTVEHALGNRDSAVIVAPIEKLISLEIYLPERSNPHPAEFGRRAVNIFKKYFEEK